jgi:hypothetical protein
MTYLYFSSQNYIIINRDYLEKKNITCCYIKGQMVRFENVGAGSVNYIFC